jgi:hypothetical protein
VHLVVLLIIRAVCFRRLLRRAPLPEPPCPHPIHAASPPSLRLKGRGFCSL